MFGKTSFFDKEMKRAEKSARAFAKRNRKEAKEVEAIMNGKKKPSMDYFEDTNRSGSAGNDTLQFFMGFLLLGGGLYWLLNSFTVTSGIGGFGGMYSLFGMHISGGVMLIPLLVGIGLIFFLDGKRQYPLCIRSDVRNDICRRCSADKILVQEKELSECTLFFLE